MPAVNRNAFQSTVEDAQCLSPEPQAPVARPAPNTSDAVIPYSQGPELGGFSSATTDVGPTCSPQELQRSAQVQAAVDEAISRKKLGAFVAAGDSASDSARNARYGFISSLTETESFEKLTKNYSAKELSDALRTSIREAAPNASDAEVSEAHQRLMGHCREIVLQQATSAMKNNASRALRDASDNFEKTAGDPRAVRELVSTVRALGGDRAAEVRQSLGLEGGVIDEKTLTDALRTRSRELRTEARNLEGAGDVTVYRSLLLHSQVAAKPGVPGSWASEGKALVMARGDADEHSIHYAKLASSVVLAAATGGLGIGSLISVGSVAAFNAPSLNATAHEIGRAKVAVSAGTADANAVTAAERKLMVEVAEAGASMVMAGASGHLGPTEMALSDAAKHGGVHAAKELGLGVATMGLGAAVTPDERGTQGNGLAQARAK